MPYYCQVTVEERSTIFQINILNPVEYITLYLYQKPSHLTETFIQSFCCEIVRGTTRVSFPHIKLKRSFLSENGTKVSKMQHKVTL